MLLVKTKIAPSAIAGTGLFADEFIPKGTYIWRFGKGFDIRVNKNYPDTLQEPAKSFFKTYAYQNPKTLNYVLCADDARFFNHSDTPNTHCVKDPEDEDTANVAFIGNLIQTHFTDLEIWTPTTEYLFLRLYYKHIHICPCIALAGHICYPDS